MKRPLSNYRIGHGYDVHRLVAGRALRVGGVAVPSELGPESHSDGDVLLHAIASALLGAIGAGDLGQHFPDGDERFRDADSAEFIAVVMGWVRDRNLRVVNVDSTVLVEAPKLVPYRSRIVDRIAGLLGVDPEHVNVKFGTGEGVGTVGRREALEAYAVVLLAPI